MLKAIYISRFFFVVLAICAILVLMGYYVNWLLYIGQFGIIVLITLTLLDALILFGSKKPLLITRLLPNRLNLGDPVEVLISLKSNANQPFYLTVFDEPPVEMQARNLSFSKLLLSKEKTTLSYTFRPTKRGEYRWRNLHVFLRSFLSLVKRKIVFEAECVAHVYPSVVQMKKYEFIMFNQQSQERGVKRIRRIGHNNEFEQIKNYIQGDDIRTINWKATSRKSQLMVNQYQDQRSQSVYSVIDKSRAMEHEFEGLTMLDHAINSALVFSNIALRNGDKVGLFTFANKMGTRLPAHAGGRHLQRIMDSLYAQKTHFLESNYPLLFQTIQRSIPSRSLLMLYTNFETELSMRGALPVLQRLNKKHVLVVVFFENTTLQETATNEPRTVRDIYVSSLAEDMINIKKRIAKELNRHGIQSVLTKPDQLSVNTLNKYLELKSKGLI
jgi:uncharacterized protein (DUF58 family)